MHGARRSRASAPGRGRADAILACLEAFDAGYHLAPTSRGNNLALRVIAGQLSFLYGVDRLGPSTEDLDKVRSVFDSLNAGKDLDVAITDADADMEDKS